jgi:2-dehydro-3-deoxygalactonokinase
MPTGVLPSGDAVSCEQSAVPRRHHAVRDRGGQDLIAIDWGTSNFRAFRLDESGKIIERRSSTEGILRVQEGRFAETLRAQVGDWLTEGESRVLLCGMVGSRQGWVEAKYLSCPVGLADLADSLVKVHFDGAEVLLIPGVIGTDSDGIPEVMRGEETEAIGILDACGGAGLVCLPGTHSKWIHLNHHTIESFITCMTGEVFSALRKCTILSRTMTTDVAIDNVAFLRGVTRSADTGGLLHHLFSVRTLALMNQLEEKSSASYLSGLLIGHEVRSAMPSDAHVHLVGAAQLCTLYAQAISACGGSSTLEDEDAAARGLAAIARRLSWI